MVKSRYCIEICNDESNIIYSTKTGRLVELGVDEYREIFTEKVYTNKDKVRKLIETEILIEDFSAQEISLEEERKRTISDYNAKDVSNYVITPTMACNARCAYCFEKDVHHDTMTESVANSVAEFIIDNYKGKTITIHWFGGEPLLAPHIIDYISNKLAGANISFASKITSNGFFLTEEIVDKALSTWNVKYIQVTLDDIGESYNKIKNYRNPGNNPFELVINNIKMALSKGLIIRIRNNYDPRDFEKTQEIIDYTWKEFEANPNIVYHMHALFSDEIVSITNRFGKNEKHPFIGVLECEQKCEELIENNYKTEKCTINSGDAKFTAWCDPRVYMENDEVTRILCKHMLYPVPLHCFGICDNSIAIDSHGDIFVCHSLLGKGSEYSSGNVSKGIVHNEVYLHYQNSTITEKMCVNCNLLPLCHGGCKFKREMYNTNQFCIPIKGCPEEALRHALKEIQDRFGSLEVLK